MDIPGSTMDTWSEAANLRFPDRRAVSDEHRSLTYRELHGEVLEASARLSRLGVRHGDRVAILMENRVEMVVLLFAITRLGAAYTPINYRFTEADIAYVLDDSGARVLVTEEKYHRTAAQAAERLVGVGPPHLWNYDLDAVAPEIDAAGSRSVVRGEDAAMLLYTSGTTSRPKGVVLTHTNLFTQVVNVVSGWGIARDDSTLVVNPMFHAVLNVMATPTLFVGGHVQLMREFDAREALSRIESGEVTVMFAVATAWQMMAECREFATASLGNLRLVASGGMAAPRTLIQSYLDKKVHFVQSYGSTETGPSATALDPEDAASAIGSSGRAYRLTEIKVVDVDGVSLAAGGAGEIWVRGGNVAHGYWGKRAESQEVFRDDGWFRTGDLGYLDDSGRLYVTDRLKDMIISGGENIASTEVEEVVYTHPAVAEVAVVPAFSERWGETPRAVIVLREGMTGVVAGDIIDHCRARMAHFKCPGIVDFVDELPKTTSGKIQKSALKESR